MSQFGLMFFTDQGQSIREMLRVLLPGGFLAVAVWNALDYLPAYAAEVELLERTAGPEAAAALRAPFVLGNQEQLMALFVAAGVASVEITTHPGTAHFPSVRVMVEADLRGWLPVMNIFLTEEQIIHILQEAEHVLKQYVTRDGTVVFDTSAYIVTGTKLE